MRPAAPLIDPVGIQPVIFHTDQPRLPVLVSQGHQNLHLRIVRPLLAAEVILLNALYYPTHDALHPQNVL